MEQLANFSEKNLALLIIVLAWSFIWKGFALWKSARRGEKIWYVCLLIINTFGILELLYLFYFSERKGKATTDIEIPPTAAIV